MFAVHVSVGEERFMLGLLYVLGNFLENGWQICQLFLLCSYMCVCADSFFSTVALVCVTVYKFM